MITWTPTDQMPDELRDGRDVLLWDNGHCTVGAWRRTLEAWLLSDGLGGFACDELGDGYCIQPTHFAEITPP